MPKVIRWRLRLLEFTFVILHLPGEDNVVADSLSRAFFHRASEVLTIDDNEKIARFHSVHNDVVGHHGVNKTVDILKAANLNWSGFKADISKFISECLICQKFKHLKDNATGDSVYHIHGSHPMQSLSIDTLGPLPEDNLGNKYILGIVDNFSKFIHLFPTRSTTAVEYISALVKHIGLFGLPLY